VLLVDDVADDLHQDQLLRPVGIKVRQMLCLFAVAVLAPLALGLHTPADVLGRGLGWFADESFGVGMVGGGKHGGALLVDRDGGAVVDIGGGV
jgi:hypothetical protein